MPSARQIQLATFGPSEMHAAPNFELSELHRLVPFELLPSFVHRTSSVTQLFGNPPAIQAPMLYSVFEVRLCRCGHVTVHSQSLGGSLLNRFTPICAHKLLGTQVSKH